jgi:hypothetical protein
VVTAVACAVGSGCSSGERTEHDASRHDPVLQECGRKINSQIEAGRIPEADREYATGMCLRHP